MFFKIDFLKHFTMFTKNPVLESPFIKVRELKACKTLLTKYSSEYSKTFKNNFFHKTPLVAASE